MNKLIRHGKVAVIISPYYGSGWSTGNEEYPEALFDPEIAKAIEDSLPIKDIEAIIDKKYPDIHYLNVSNLELVWLPEGTKFIINEYDGRESIQMENETDWLIA